MITSEQLEALRSALGSPRGAGYEVPSHEHACRAITALGERFRAGTPLLRALWAAGDGPVPTAAAAVLGAMGDAAAASWPEVRRKFVESGWIDNYSEQKEPLEALLDAEPQQWAYDRLLPLFGEDPTADEQRLQLATFLLWEVGRIRPGSDGKFVLKRPQMYRDPRWHQLAERLLAAPTSAKAAGKFREHAEEPAAEPSRPPSMQDTLQQSAVLVSDERLADPQEAVNVLGEQQRAAAEAAGILTTLWSTAEQPTAGAARAALSAMGHPTATAADFLADPDTGAAVVAGRQQKGAYLDLQVKRAVETVVGAEPATAYSRLEPSLTGDRLQTLGGAAIAGLVLRNVGREAAVLDPRFADCAAGLLSHPLLRSAARELLVQVDSKVLNAAITRARGPARRKPKPPPLPDKRDYLARYEAGEHEAVWRELGALGATAVHPEMIEEVRAVAAATMTRVRRNLEHVVACLQKHKYKLRKKRSALGNPADVSKTVAQIEKLIGGPLPLSIIAFYEHVGSVDLTEDADAPVGKNAVFEQLGQDDPLVVLPIKTALSELKATKSGNRGFPKALHDPYGLFVSPSQDAKATPDADDDEPLRMPVPLPAADGYLGVRGAEEEAFVSYLRRVLLGGGFAALKSGDISPDWPGHKLLTENLIAF